MDCIYEGWRYMFGSEAFPGSHVGLLLFFVPKTPALSGDDDESGSESILYSGESKWC